MEVAGRGPGGEAAFLFFAAAAWFVVTLFCLDGVEGVAGCGAVEVSITTGVAIGGGWWKFVVVGCCGGLFP